MRKLLEFFPLKSLLEKILFPYEEGIWQVWMKIYSVLFIPIREFVVKD